jgi:hypothetical protein
MSVQDRSTLKAPNPANPVAVEVDERGRYLTNEIFLYRIVDRVVGGADEIVELEDCYGLDVVRVPAEELRARGLRVVMSA